MSTLDQKDLTATALEVIRTDPVFRAAFERADYRGRLALIADTVRQLDAAPRAAVGAAPC